MDTSKARSKQQAPAPGKAKEKKPRYNESEAIQAFLSSEKGITFLIDRAKEAKMQAVSGRGQARDTGYIVDEVLDFYAAWSFGCPVRRNNTLSQYELIKKIEDYCCKPEVKSIEFVKARAEEIRRLEELVHTTRKKTMLFQRLPFHKRRRSRSFRGKGRRPRTSGIRTWLAKRFRMAKMYGTELPLQRYAKSDSFVYKSFGRGFLFYESHKRAYVFDKSASSLPAGERVETERYVLVVTMDDVPCGAAPAGCLDTPVAVLGRVHMEEGVYTTGRDMRSEWHVGARTLDDYIDGCICGDADAAPREGALEFAFVRSHGGLEQGRVFVQQKLLMGLWQKMVLRGFIPVSIDELLRIGLETKVLVFPFDHAHTALYAEYERERLAPVMAKYNRTPAAKKPRKTSDVMCFEPCTGGRLLFFDVPSGKVRRCADVFCDGTRVGSVLRAAYCYSIGRVRGICMVEGGKEGGALSAANVESPGTSIPIVLAHEQH
ncbi:UNVERIFIED_CONTAM: hypothetical protein PYX00_011423 [Menopon gallinae]|uniref:Uncharacterized protein n=1 Tax=Menopon gallinae TaxID=328185 RepID=A0AAW2H7D5_9NEOP